MTILVQQQLREQAMKATPGPWTWKQVGTFKSPGCSIFWADKSKPGIHWRRIDSNGGMIQADADFIATANPTTVLALLDEIDRLKHSLGVANANRDHLARELRQALGVQDRLKAENAELLGLMRGVVGEFPHRHKRSDGNGPGHGHRIPGVWDSDNGELAGKPCAWCSIWNAAKGIVERHDQEMTKDKQP